MRLEDQISDNYSNDSDQIINKPPKGKKQEEKDDDLAMLDDFF